MMFKSQLLPGIEAGEITRTYRRWKKLQVKEGGNYHIYPIGTIQVTGINRLTIEDIRETDVFGAGFGSTQEMVDYLDRVSTQ